MRKRLFLAIIISLALIFSLSLMAAAGSRTGKISISPMGPAGKSFLATGTTPAPNYVPGEILVKYKTQISSAAINSFQSQLNITELKKFKRTGIRHLQLPAGTTVEEALKNFKNNPDVEYAQPNYIYHITATTPNDSYFTSLWGLHNTGQNVNGTSGTSGADIKAPEAWDIATGNSSITVAIVDTGVDYNHPDLINNISSVFLYDYVNGNGQPMDPHGHGTHLAGTIAAEGNNSLGVVGVTWSTTIMPLRAADAYGDFYSALIVSAVEDAADQGANIINASFGNACGYSGYDLAVYNAIVYARGAGVLFVAAAGNCGVNNDTSATPSYPASYNLDNIIAVASTDQNDVLSSFSNYGATKVHVGAPGENIYSTKPSRQTIFSENFDGDGSSLPAGWTHGGTADTWGLSSTTYYSSPYALAVNPGGNYSNSANAWVRTPAIDLSSSLGTVITLNFTGRSQSPNDGFYVEASVDGTNWDNWGFFYGNYSSSWYTLKGDFGKYNGSSTFYIRLRFVSDASTSDIGFFFDDVTITAASASYSVPYTNYYQFMSGTSMATPHVAGLAALIWGYAPGLTYLQVKDIILRSVDLKSSLTGKTVSGGRINAYKALNFCITPATPVSLTASAAAFNQINLSWTASAYATGYTLQRKKGAGLYATIATPNANATSYNDTGLDASSTYYYQLLASNYGGDSGYSGEASATTPAAPPPSSGGGGGGCFIATAAFGSPLEKHVQILRDFRDRILLGSAAGQAFVEFYYRVSPPIAQTIAENEILRLMTRASLMPVIGAAYLTLHWGGAATLLFLIIMVLIFVTVIWTMRRKLMIMRSRTSI